MTLEEAIKAAEELAEWYVEGMGDVHDIAYPRQKRDLDMLEFFISLGKELDQPEIEEATRIAERISEWVVPDHPGEGGLMLLARTFLKIINKGGKKSDPNSPGEGFRRGGYLGDAID